MPLLIEDAFLPATLTAAPMTDEEFARFCAEHPDLFFEMTSEGELIVMPPTYSRTGARHMKIHARLEIWAEQDGRGIATDSTTGFVLPKGARRSPDAAWTSRAEIAKLSPESQEGFWHLCPAFVIEVRSSWDRLKVLRAKLREYIENGAKLGWLIGPETRSVEIYRPDREPELIQNPDQVAGEGPVEGFVLDLRKVWDPFAS
jgi:Uma2 family endonuclease